MNSNSTNRRIVNGLQKFAKRIPLAQAFGTGPTCSVNIKDAKRPKVVMSITLELSLCMIATGKPAFHLIERVTLIDSILARHLYEVGFPRQHERVWAAVGVTWGLTISEADSESQLTGYP